VSGDTIVVDLDRNTVVVGGLVYPVPPPPPKKFHKLRSCLLDTVGHIFWRARGQEDEYRSRLQQQKGSKRNLDGLKEDSRQWSEKLTSLDHAFNLAYTPDSPNLLSDALPDDERQQWDRVQSAFLRFFTALFKGYDKFIRSPGPGKFSFDRDGFVASRKGEQGAFLEDLCSTQQFDDFTSRRMYSPGEPDLVFFDQSVNAKLNRSKFKIRKEPTPFLQSAQVHKELKRIPAVEVNLEGLTASRFAYDKWPDEFDPTLFSKPRPVPKMISAEFDRQRDLVSKLRAFDPDADGEDVLVEAHGGDYDESPEVASFTVFFFVYASLVGRDWQEYQRRRSTEVGASQSSQNSSYRDNIPFDCGVAEGIEVVDMSESERTAAVTGCFEDLSMGLCEACPEDSLLALKSAIIYCGDGAQDAYARLFATTAETVAELQLQLSAAAMHQNDEQPPEDAEDALIEYEEAKEVAGAQLDLAFEMLKTMALRALSTDFDAYRSLIEACGRCGDTQRALQLIEMMRNDGFVPDGEVLGCFVAAFAHDGVSTDEGSVEVTVDTSRIDGPSAGTPKSDAYSKYLKKKLASASKGGSLSLSSLSDWRPASFNRPAASPCGPTEELTADAALSETSSVSSTDWTRKSPTGGTAFLDWMSSHYLHHQHRQDGLPLVGGGNVVGSTGPRRRKARKRGRRRVTAGPEATGPDAMHPVTDVVAKQLELSGALLDFLYPDLQLDGSDCCPHCSHELSEADVVAGWTHCSFQDCTSACPKCQFRFVPRFAVSSSSPDFCGSQGPQTPLYCEFLSPWVLRKELQYIIKGTANGTGGNGSVSVGIWGMLKPSWRQGTGIEATLFWNLVMMCRRYRLPYSFLFQSSFQNGKTRLALPRIPVEMF
jgi:pentatricopeptide repeat protein